MHLKRCAQIDVICVYFRVHHLRCVTAWNTHTAPRRISTKWNVYCIWRWWWKWRRYYFGIRVLDEQNKQHDSSHDVEDADGDGTDAVEYGSCQHPVVLHLILLVGLVALLFFAANSSLEKIADFRQQFVRRRAFRCFRVWRYLVDIAVEAAVTDDANTSALSVASRPFSWRRKRPLHVQPRCQSLAEKIFHLLWRKTVHMQVRHGTGSLGHRVNGSFGSSFTSGSPGRHFYPVWDPNLSGFQKMPKMQYVHLKCWNDKSHCQVSVVGVKSLDVSPCNELLPMIIKKSLTWEYFFTHKSTFRTGSPGQLGLRVAGFPGHCVARSHKVTQFLL